MTRQNLNLGHQLLTGSTVMCCKGRGMRYLDILINPLPAQAQALLIPAAPRSLVSVSRRAGSQE